MNFLSLYFQLFIRPGRSYERILSDPRKLRYGFLALLVPALGYSLFYIMAWQADGAPSAFRPWLAIPMDQYFRYAVFLSLPGYYLAWLAATGTVFLVSSLWGRSGNYADMLVVTGFGIGVASWSSLLHDLVDAFLSVTGIIDMARFEQLLNEPGFWRTLLWTLYIIYILWFLLLFTKGYRKTAGIGTGRALLLAFIGLVSFQLTLLIFIR